MNDRVSCRRCGRMQPASHFALAEGRWRRKVCTPCRNKVSSRIKQRTRGQIEAGLIEVVVRVPEGCYGALRSYAYRLRQKMFKPKKGAL